MPFRGVTPSPNDEVTAYVFDHFVEDLVEVGRGRTDPIALAIVGGRAMYPFDLGTGCGHDCELSIPPYAWRGFGPFTARFRIHSAAEGWLLAHGEPCGVIDSAPPRITLHGRSDRSDF